MMENHLSKQDPVHLLLKACVPFPLQGLKDDPQRFLVVSKDKEVVKCSAGADGCWETLRQCGVEQKTGAN